MKRYSNWRIKAVSFIVLFFAGLLIFSAYRLQILYHQKYTLISDKNRIRVAPILPRRGRIITADGVTIAQTINRYKLILTRCKKEEFNKAISFIENKIQLDEQDLQHIYQEYKNRRNSIVIKDNLSWDEYTKIAENVFKINQLNIENSPVREYVNPNIFCHITGYTSKTSEGLQTLYGKAGLEFSFDEVLTGEIGGKQTEVNAAGKAMRTLSIIPEKNGVDLRITIDSKLQKFVYDLMQQHIAGGCAVLDMDGNVLAMVSVPGFDTNLLSGKITTKQWDDLKNDQLFPMLNRVTGCAYPPGSVFKIVVAAAALNEGVIDLKDKIFCSGGVKQDNHVFHCWNRGGHGYLNLTEALQYSCDCYFFEIAKKLGIDKIVKYAEKFGYGAKTNIEISGESAGLLPTKQWKFLRYKTHWKPYETMIAGIGQGAVTATVMQTATMLGRLYTNNLNFSPSLIAKEKDKNTETIINDKYADTIKRALTLVCSTGTAAGSCNTSYGIAGKTGSSQVRKLRANEAGMHQSNFDWKYRDHAFFGGVAPLPNPKYIVVVFIEHGGGGGSVAAPIARKIFDELMKRK